MQVLQLEGAPPRAAPHPCLLRGQLLLLASLARCSMGGDAVARHQGLQPQAEDTGGEGPGEGHDEFGACVAAVALHMLQGAWVWVGGWVLGGGGGARHLGGLRGSRGAAHVAGWVVRRGLPGPVLGPWCPCPSPPDP